MLRLFAAVGTVDGAIGSRWVPGSKLTVRQGILRRMESRGFNLLIRLLFGLRYHDTQCGAKVFRKAAVDTVLPAMISRGFEFDVELLWRLRSAGFTIVEVPIEWQNKGDSRVRKRDMINMLAGLLAIRFHRAAAMILLSPDEQKKEAFRLFEDGRYQESLQVCNHLLESGREPALEVLAATNLYYTGRHRGR